MLILDSLSLLQVQDSTKFDSEIMELPKLLKDYECAKHGQEFRAATVMLVTLSW